MNYYQGVSGSFFNQNANFFILLKFRKCKIGVYAHYIEIIPFRLFCTFSCPSKIENAMQLLLLRLFISMRFVNQGNVSIEYLFCGELFSVFLQAWKNYSFFNHGKTVVTNSFLSGECNSLMLFRIITHKSKLSNTEFI